MSRIPRPRYSAVATRFSLRHVVTPRDPRYPEPPPPPGNWPNGNPPPPPLDELLDELDDELLLLDDEDERLDELLEELDSEDIELDRLDELLLDEERLLLLNEEILDDNELDDDDRLLIKLELDGLLLEDLLELNGLDDERDEMLELLGDTIDDLLPYPLENGTSANDPEPDLPEAPDGFVGNILKGTNALDEPERLLPEVNAETPVYPIATLLHPPLPSAPALWLTGEDILGWPCVSLCGPVGRSLVGITLGVSAIVTFVYSWVFSATIFGSPNIIVPKPWNGAFACDGISRRNPQCGRYESPDCFGDVVVFSLISNPSSWGLYKSLTSTLCPLIFVPLPWTRIIGASGFATSNMRVIVLSMTFPRCPIHGWYSAVPVRWPVTIVPCCKYVDSNDAAVSSESMLDCLTACPRSAPNITSISLPRILTPCDPGVNLAVTISHILLGAVPAEPFIITGSGWFAIDTRVGIGFGAGGFALMAACAASCSAT
jgi:hypothetical protein